MPNISVPMGLQPYFHDDGGYTRSDRWFVPATNATAIFRGDPVVRTASGLNVATQVPECARAAAGGPFTGVAMGFFPTGSLALAGGAHLPASTGMYVDVYTNVNQLYTIRGNGAALLTAAQAATAVGLNASVSYATAGNTLQGWSGATLDESTLATTASLPLKIVDFLRLVTNELGQFPVFVVKINQHTMAVNTAGI